MELFVVVLVSVPLGILAVAGIGHAFAFRRFVDDLRRQGLIRVGVPLVAGSVVFAELTLGVGVHALIVLRAVDGPATAGLMAAAALLYAAFSAYAGALLHVRPGAPCGCGHRHRVVTGWVVARAAVLAGCAVAGAAAAELDSRVDVTDLAMGGTAALAIGFVLWMTPDAMERGAG